MSNTISKEFQNLISRAEANWRERLSHALEKLAGQGVASFAEIIALLPAMGQEDRWPALEALAHYPKGRAVPALLKLIEDRDVRDRWQLLWPLDRLGGKRVYRALIRLMQEDSDPEVRRSAAYHLRWLLVHDDLDERPACEALMVVLANRAEQPLVRAEAAEGIGFTLELHDMRTRIFKQAARLLIETLADPAPEVRFWSCYGLMVMRARAGLPELRRLAETDDAMCPGWWSVSEEARDAITVIQGGRPPERTPASWIASTGTTPATASDAV